MKDFYSCDCRNTAAASLPSLLCSDQPVQRPFAVALVITFVMLVTQASSALHSNRKRKGHSERCICERVSVLKKLGNVFA